MKAITYRAPSMPEALARVQAELGPEALVLAARRVLAGPAWQVWRGYEFEVLALPGGVTGDEWRVTPHAPRSRRSSGVHPAKRPSTLHASPAALTRAYRRLAEQGVDDDLAAQMASGAVQSLGPLALGDPARVRDYFARELAAHFPVGEYLPRKGERRVVALVGPSGAGKTCAAAKLAAYAHYILGRSAALISVDTFRVGALAQIQTFAEILRLPLSVAYTPADLASALAAQGEADVVFVDTPARNPRRPTEVVELAALLTPLPRERRVFLAAAACGKRDDLLSAAAAFGGLGLNGLVFTKMDETDSFGALFSLAHRTRLPASYFCSGARVPEDIEPATADRMAALLLGEPEGWLQ